MINIHSIFDQVLLNESAKPKHIFETGDITFADIRDTLQKVLQNGIMMSDKVPGIDVLITYKDGEFYIQIPGEKLSEPCKWSKFTSKCCVAGKNVKNAFENSIHDLADALDELDPVELNRFFANGQNFMECHIAYPPEDYCPSYGNKCFIAFNKLKCYDTDFKEIGEDSDSAMDLFNALKSSNALHHEVAEITNPCICRIKKSMSGKRAMEQICEVLNKFIDGVGWGCSLNSYIQDKYSRHIINKALEYGLDVSRNSNFVNELANRMSGTSIRPTRSDLVTFAKREGLDCKSDSYKNFLADIEQDADEVCKKIIQPIENLIYKALIMAVRNAVGYMSLDPSEKTQKFVTELNDTFPNLDEDDCEFCADQLKSLKKNLAKIDQYSSALPPSVVIMYKSKPYQIASKCGNLSDLCNIINFK